jgi:hypothetical protein
MSTHPNVLLLLRLSPDDLARKTYRAILSDAGVSEDRDLGEEIKIDGKGYHHLVMESDYDDGWQISGSEGQIIVFDLVTYGYGESVKWDELATQKTALERWAADVCKKHHCTHEISVGANYW